MTSGLRAGLAGSRLVSIAAALTMAAGLVGACFDSDEKPVPFNPTTSTTGPPPGTSTSTTTTGISSTTAEPEVTCRDAIDCVVGCAGELQQSMLPEPDLTCFLECEENLTVGEALHLFRLTECVTNKCIAQGVCDILVPTETTSGGESSSSDGGSSSSGGSTTGTGSGSGTGTGTGTSTSTSTGAGNEGGPSNPCLDCILANMLDAQPGGECQGLADECV